MLKTTSIFIAFSFPSIELEEPKNLYAETIPYESLYEKLPPNKNTMEYNFPKAQELIEEENKKLINRIFN